MITCVMATPVEKQPQSAGLYLCYPLHGTVLDAVNISDSKMYIAKMWSNILQGMHVREIVMLGTGQMLHTYVATMYKIVIILIKLEVLCTCHWYRLVGSSTAAAKPYG